MANRDSVTGSFPHITPITKADLDLAKGNRAAGYCKSILWFLALISFSYTTALLAASFYIIILPFAFCMPKLKTVTSTLLIGVQLPYICVESMVRQYTLKEAFQKKRDI